MQFHDSDPRYIVEPNYELSQEELESLHRSLAYSLILSGNPEDNPGSRIPGADGAASRFTLPVPSATIKEIFCPAESDGAIKPGSIMTYEPPHHTDDIEDHAIYENVDLRYEVQLLGVPITRLVYVLLQNKDSVYSGDIITEYIDTENERVIPDDVAPIDIKNPSIREIDMIQRKAWELETAQDSLSPNDVENLRWLSLALLKS